MAMLVAWASAPGSKRLLETITELPTWPKPPKAMEIANPRMLRFGSL